MGIDYIDYEEEVKAAVRACGGDVVSKAPVIAAVIEARAMDRQTIALHAVAIALRSIQSK